MKGAKTYRRLQWRMLLGTMCCYLFFYMGRHNFGWAAKEITEDLHISYSQVGWINFSMLMGYALGQLINGNMADHYSPRKMVLWGGLGSVAVNFAISFSHSYSMIMVLWTLNGYFQSLAWAPGSRIISNWWPEPERGRAFGLYTMAAGFSTVLTFLFSIMIVHQHASWQLLFRLPVLFLLVAVIVFYLMVRDQPADMGLPNLIEESEKAEKTSWKETYRHVFRNREFMMASLAMGFENMARYGLITWVPVHYLGSNWQQHPRNLWAILLLPVGMAIGAVFFGTISDRLLNYNRPAAIRIGMLASAAVTLVICLSPAINLFAGGVLMFAAGFFVYGPQSAFWLMSPDLLTEKYIGTGVGIMNMSAYVFAAVGDPLWGYLIDKTGKTSSVFGAVIIICLLCAATISRIRYKDQKSYPVAGIGN
ncbi:MFS transporter [Niabella pedocola]|uniref:MFS transporter n=1 Tax=Niabella pedocola TaxID=1752077 RepID=A0ABS8PN84_9BACT|nr:MFS transporter [Niabella pedocola]MCD2422568.1 MFS transporter [Niabella pedocola]